MPDRSDLADLFGDLLPSTTFPDPGTELTCGVSGGADSLALMVLGVAAGCSVTAVHVDHGQRAGSAAEADHVRQAADVVGAAFRAERVHVEPGPNLEARMRSARYGVLGPLAATGHTVDDQAETVLLNLVRGAGIVGLGAMEPGPRRPILGLRRHQTVEVCVRMGLDPILDPSNADPAHVRNRIRHEVLPLLNDVAARDVAPLLARTSAHARDTADVVEMLARSLDPTDALALADAPVAVASRAIQTWIRTQTGSEHPVDRTSIERVLAVAHGQTIAAEVVGGFRVSRSNQRLSIAPIDPS